MSSAIAWGVLIEFTDALPRVQVRNIIFVVIIINYYM